MTAAQDLWEQIYNEFEPEQPASDPTRRVERAYSPVPDILTGLSRPFGPKKFLITGSVGAGKTTELHRIAEQRVDAELVVFFDVRAHFQDTIKDPHALNNLQSWQLLFLLGLAIYATGQSKLGHKWDKAHTKALQQALADLEGEDSGGSVDIGKLASSLFVLVGGVSGALVGSSGAGAVAGKIALDTVNAAAAAVKWSLPFAQRRREPRPDQDGEVEAMLNAVNTLIATLQTQYRRVLILLDGLDRITEPDTIEALFVRSDLLARLACPLVAIAPIRVRRQLMDSVRTFEAKDLVNVPVVDREAPAYPALGGGVEFFRELVQLRMRKLGLEQQMPLTAGQIERMAWYSGGRARDFVKLVRGVAERAYDASRSVASEEHVHSAIDEARRKKESGLNSEEIELLERVLADERRRLPGGELAIALLDKQRLVPYPNESTWYFPHPLLTLSMLRPS